MIYPDSNASTAEEKYVLVTKLCHYLYIENKSTFTKVKRNNKSVR
jgi:hypothetical protein